MLTRDEITSKVFPNIQTERYPNGFNNHIPSENWVKSTVFKDKPLNLFLPLARQNQHKRSPAHKSQIIKPNKSVESESPLNEKKRKKYKDDALNRIVNKVQGVHSKLKDLEKHSLDDSGVGGAKEFIVNTPFNLQALKDKVYQLTHGTDARRKHELTQKYRKHAIENKKDSRSIEEFNSVQRSREYLHLQKMIWSVEYDNMVNMQKRKSNKENTEWQKQLNRGKNDFSSIHPQVNTHNINPSTSRFNGNARPIRILKENSNNNNFIYEKYNQNIWKKYSNNLKVINKEINKHYESKVFNEDKINEIILNKNELELSLMKFDFIDKHNKLVDLTKKVGPANDRVEHVESKNKSGTFRKIGGKVYGAFEVNESGTRNMDFLKNLKKSSVLNQQNNDEINNLVELLNNKG